MQGSRGRSAPGRKSLAGLPAIYRCFLWCLGCLRRRCRRAWVAAPCIGLAALGITLIGAPGNATPQTDVIALRALATRLAIADTARRTPVYVNLYARRDGPAGWLNTDPDLQLIGTDVRGHPLYNLVDNLNAALTISTARLWPGGSSGLGLTGENPPGTLAMWDAGAVRTSHQEFAGRVSYGDDPGSTQAHATHVAGTLIAAGVEHDAHGMSPAGQLVAYDWLNDEAEMALAAAGNLRISNHSYGVATGWYRTSVPPYVHYWFGDVTLDPNEDAGFGFYSTTAAAWDAIAYLAPHYLIFKSAGNDRDDTGPEPGGGHYYWDPNASDYVWSTEPRAPDGGDTGYDTLPYYAVAKNIVTVGAVADIPGGYSVPGDVVMSAFSGWGPADDGRIKPDLVANGVALKSAIDTGDADYASFNGTSMAAPSAAGSANLLLQHYLTTHGGTPPLAASLKALLIHTAAEAGQADGPDYRFGWGLLDSEAAAAVITADTSGRYRMREELLGSGEVDTFTFVWNGEEAIKVTLAWTDPPGEPPLWSLDSPERMLVHDLDLRLARVDDTGLILPWVLDPADPDAPATRGDNSRDNVEHIRLAAPDSGLYRVLVSHKSTLLASQTYALIQSGLVPPPPVAPMVSNVAVLQRRDGSGLVDIYYDLLDPDSASVTVTMNASTDGGLTWDLPLMTVTGDVGPGVTPGLDRTVVWDFARDHPGRYLNTCVVEVIADDE